MEGKSEMEKSKDETLALCSCGDRGSHLKSETYRTLARIISHCYGHSQVLLGTPQIHPHLLSPDNGGTELGQLATERGLRESGELVTSDGTGPESLSPQETAAVAESYEAFGFQDTGFSDTRMVIDEIDHLLATEENEYLLKQMDVIVDNGTEGTDSQDKELGREQVLMNELMQIITGKEELLHDNNSNHMFSLLDKNQNGDCVVASVINLEENFDNRQIVMEKPGGVGELLVDEEQCSQKIAVVFDSSVDNGRMNEVPKASDKSSSLKTNALAVQFQIPQKEMDTKISMCTSGTVGSLSGLSEDSENEEGEVSGDDDVAVVSEEKKADSMEVSKDVIGEKEFALNEQCGVNSKHSLPNSAILDSANNASNSGKVEPKGHVRNLLYYGEILEHSTVGNLEMSLNSKQDAGICNKRKRGTPSQERKVKKKQRERKKRAIKNQRLGNKRLKLDTVLKPKTVSICRHYLKGRCQEGDKCKFSHDAVPLTKSKPCCHFARHSCMKGDHCPFDHQLSKYLCSNFEAKGFCSRGDDCMFSHKITFKEDAPSPSNACKSELKPASFLENLNVKTQPNTGGASHQNASALSNSVRGFSYKNSEKNMVEALLKSPASALAPRGISFLSVGKSSGMESSKVKQVNLSPKRNEIVKVGNQTDSNALGTVQSMIEIPKRTPLAVVPKGINFLSFGNAPLKDYSIKRTASLSLSGEDCTKPSLFTNLSVFKQACSTPNDKDKFKIGNQAFQSPSSTLHKSNETLMKSGPAMPLQGMDFLSKRHGLPSGSINGINGSVQESQNASDKHQNSPSSLPAYPLSFGQSRDHFVCGHFKNTPNSAEKALMSTLAFAEKFEFQMKINRGTVSTGNHNKTGNSYGSSQND
ncbi:zf-CCCH domain-containing protein [Cephalotus follicularis]|uniref:Zf-CCCH domain-containing protein n=1 Tax=Cephalotus follicularis TaxID=3775 RepID=A0A1Q3CMC3_CEPFO|nr:zf-CCCH domain-containing protein [Cephalotus follicularis]